ncbi:hypothetical protein F2Q65_18785 [Thiohalocapsa marina]|uniref:Uncharacterized protein n=1 Tax=Thiohalocapsa marina TaxID=424902 RepID=A0A5M8FBX8_9GAMM|nr:hypothetical protein [Thiohalocapsa marina]KAA6181844.1 hypothetical protein F2Q65_18785 [Thiohalocapsa marina]
MRLDPIKTLLHPIESTKRRCNGSLQIPFLPQPLVEHSFGLKPQTGRCPTVAAIKVGNILSAQLRFDFWRFHQSAQS